MKLTYFQLESQLAKKLSSHYLISSDEILLTQDAIQLIRKAAKNAGFERYRLSENEDEIAQSLYATSLLSEKRLLELSFRDHAPNKNLAKILQEYAEHPLPETILLIDMGKLDARLAKQSWIKAFEATGIHAALWPPPREQLPQWILSRAQKTRLQILPEGAKLLAEYVEGNLVAAAQALEQIYLMKWEKPVDAEMIQQLLTDESHYTIFDFTDSLMASDKSRSLHILNHLREEGTEPVLLLWSITRELRLLAEYANELQQGLTMNELFQRKHIFLRRQPLIRQCLKRLTMKDCLQLLKHALELDRIIKGAAVGNFWENLQLFCLRM